MSFNRWAISDTPVTQRPGTEYKAAYISGEIDNDKIAQKMKELIGLMSDSVKRGMEEKLYRKIDPMMLSIFLAALTEGMLQFKKLGVLDSMKVSDTDFREFMINVIGKGIERTAE